MRVSQCGKQNVSPAQLQFETPDRSVANHTRCKHSHRANTDDTEPLHIELSYVTLVADTPYHGRRSFAKQSRTPDPRARIYTLFTQTQIAQCRRVVARLSVGWKEPI